jgi:DNA-binding response OmpR family regulator
MSAPLGLTDGARGGRILIVDEARDLVDLLSVALTAAGYDVLTADGPGTAAAAVRDHRPDLGIIDMNVGRWDGLAVLRRLRLRGNMPIIMLTERGTQAERAVCRALGADECLTKPFRQRELMALVKESLGRKQTGRSAAGQVRVGPLLLDPERRGITKNGQPLDLSATEYRILRHLMLHAGKAVAADTILREVWGPGHRGGSILLRTALQRLGQKIDGDPEQPPLLQLTAAAATLTAKQP